MSGDPRVAADERTRKGLGLANRAAALAELDATIEGVDAVLANVGFQRARVWQIQLDVDAVMIANPIDQCVGFVRQAPGIERKHRDGQ